VQLSDSDRERLFEKLSRHAAAGRLELAELERRVEAVAAAQTREEAATVMSDLPALPGEPAPARARGRRGHGDAQAPGVDWLPTGERFRDPRTNRVMRVWEDAAGARHYVVDDAE
jgi:Domain of unknown function (DUF1707)